VVRLLDRRSLIARMSAGNEPVLQSIAANVDTLFVVTSCNADFNPSRLERYLEADDKGRHTTTARYLLRAPCGAWLIDTPGMRELKIGAAQAGLGRTFVDIESLATECRFRDCSHQNESGCAVRSAIDDGRLDPRRMESYLKLVREAERATSPTWRRRQEQRRFGRIARAAQKQRRKDTGRD
jgi:ribosome biogenesis GTPase